MKRKVVIVTGPTGGHFFPGLAIGERLRELLLIKFFVPQREYIMRHLNSKNFDYRIISYVKFNKKNLIFSIFKLFYLIYFSFLLYRREKPALIIGTGSYVCIPYIISGKLLRKKIILHEQNYLPGKATKFLSFFADYIFLTFPKKLKIGRRKCVVTGFPLLSEFDKELKKEEILEEIGLEKNRKTLLIIGGSQGAFFLNNLIIDNLQYFKRKNFQIVHIAGKEKSKIEKIYEKENIKGKVFEFFYEMNKLYTIADYIICRAGAGTIVEITKKKVPAFLIPYPYAGGHQKKNAEFLEKIGCGKMVEEKDLKGNKFQEFFEEFLKNAEKIKENLKRVDLSDNGRIKDIILELIK